MKSKAKSSQARERVLRTLSKLYFGVRELKLMEHYIEHIAPLTIHVNLQKVLKFFLKDNKYRNQFETRTSGGTLNGQVRKMWERGMFGAICDSLRNSERVKYGACNLTNDPNGVRKAHHYGDSFFQLNENVRCRTSICNMDSGSGYGNTNLQIGTLSHCMHVLEKLPQQEIKSIINAARASEESSNQLPIYREIQIHGDIDFARDVDRLVVSTNVKRNQRLMKDVKTFCEKYDVQLDFRREVGDMLG